MNEIITELQELHLVLQWSTVHELHDTALTVGERIMINQQRAALFRALEGEPAAFQQSPEIQSKLIRIQYLIQRTKWVPNY